MTMTDYATQARPASRGGTPRPKRRPGRKPKGNVPVVVSETADQPDPDHVLTWRQRKILRTIRESVQRRGYPPSMLEIGEAVGLTSTSSVSYQLSILQRKGYLHRDVGRARTMKLRLPGLSQEAEGTLFLLKVGGDAMINAAMADGDWVVVRQQDAQDGDIVAATAYTPILGDEARIVGRVIAVLRRVLATADAREIVSARLAATGIVAQRVRLHPIAVCALAHVRLKLA
jgi:repressor LexA